MGMIILAVPVTLIGGFIRAAGPLSKRPGTRGASKLAAYGSMAVGVLLLVGNGSTVISVGEVGVQPVLLGTLPAGSVVYVPTEGGVPLVRSIGGGS